MSRFDAASMREGIDMNYVLGSPWSSIGPIELLVPLQESDGSIE